MADTAWINANYPIFDDFTIGADANLTTHVTTVGGWPWTRVGTGLINDVAATGKATDADTVTKPIYYVNHGVGTADYSVQCDIAYPNQTDVVEVTITGRYDGLIFGSHNGYGIVWLPDASGGTILLVKFIPGGTTNLGNIIQAGTSHTVKLVMSGTSISGYSDGVLIASVSDAAVAGPGFAGIGSGLRALRFGTSGSNHATYDNFTVTIP